jgi:hypothetical protein
MEMTKAPKWPIIKVHGQSHASSGAMFLFEYNMEALWLLLGFGPVGLKLVI